MSVTFSTDSTESAPLPQQMLGSGPGSPPVLLNHPTQSAMTTNGIAAALFGIPFCAAGIGIGAIGRNVTHASKHPPAWLLLMFGGMFFSVGLFMFLHGVRGMIRRSVWRREAAQFPGQPWLFDFHWRKEGVSFSAFKAMMGRLLGALVWNAFLIPFFWVGFTQRGAFVFAIFAGLFWLVGLVFWVRWVQMLGDLLRYGNSFLAYDEFPYFLGGKLCARLHAPCHLAAIDSLTLTLRCVQERYVTSGSGNQRSTQVVCYELYSDVASLDRDGLANYIGGDIPIEFQLPANKQPTVLADAPPRYWEIEARGKARGADYEAYFLVPVYQRT
jgi:hypothetical protein